MLDACAKRGAEFSRTCFLGTRQRRDPKGKNDDNDDIIAQKLSPTTTTLLEPSLSFQEVGVLLTLLVFFFSLSSFLVEQSADDWVGGARQQDHLGHQR